MTELPRVLLCSFESLPGPTGTSRRLTEYAKGLDGRFDVTLLGTKRPDVSHIERYHGARLLRVPLGSGGFEAQLLTFERALRRQLESEEYAVVHATDPFSGAILADRRRGSYHQLVYEAHGFPSVEYPELHPELGKEHRLLARARRQELFCLMSAEAVVVGSELTRTYVERLGVPPARVHLLRAPADLAEAAEARRIDPDRLPAKAVYVGSTAPWQGLPTLLRAVARAREKAPLSLLLLCPDHPVHTPALRRLVRELGLEAAVELAAAVPHADVPLALARADIAVAPLERSERNETQGGELAKVSDYMAAGRPIVAANLPLARETLPIGGTLFYPPGDVEALADRLAELALDPGRRVAMGQACAAAAALVDTHTIRGSLLALYRQLLGDADSVTGDSDDDDGVTTLSPAPLTEVSLSIHGPDESLTQVAEMPKPREDTTDRAGDRAGPAAPFQQLPLETEPGSPPVVSHTDSRDFWLGMVVGGYTPPESAAKGEVGQSGPPPLPSWPRSSKP